MLCFVTTGGLDHNMGFFVHNSRKGGWLYKSSLSTYLPILTDEGNGGGKGKMRNLVSGVPELDFVDMACGSYLKHYTPGPLTFV